MTQLSEYVLVVSCIDPDAYSANTYYGDAVDMHLWEKVVYVLQAGDLGSSATVDYAICTGATTSPTTAITALTATQLTQSPDDSNKQVVLEVDAQTVLRAGHRYIRDRLIVATATSDVGAIGFGIAAHFSPGTDLTTVDEILVG